MKRFCFNRSEEEEKRTAGLEPFHRVRRTSGKTPEGVDRTHTEA